MGRSVAIYDKLLPIDDMDECLEPREESADGFDEEVEHDLNMISDEILDDSNSDVVRISDHSNNRGNQNLAQAKKNNSYEK